MSEKEIQLTCKNCGHIQRPAKEKSNKNWNVLNPRCDKCDGELRIDFGENND